MIRLEQVTKRIGKFQLGPISFQASPGYVVAVVGPNGSGKTTLFRLVTHLLHPDQGEIALFGLHYPDQELPIKRRTAYLPDRDFGFPKYQAGRIARYIASWYETWDDALFERMIREYEVDMTSRYDRLSKGKQAIFQFVAAVAAGADLLLLDEPTDGIDPFVRSKILAEISSFVERAEEQRLVLFATHILEEVTQIADFILLMNRGRQVGFYEKDALLDRWGEIAIPPQVDLSTFSEVVKTEKSPTHQRLITQSLTKTLEKLRENGVTPIHQDRLPLEKILATLLEMEEKTTSPSRLSLP